MTVIQNQDLRFPHICNYNGALTGEISDNIIGYLGNLTQS